MARPKGSPKLAGRQKGTPNKITASVREMIEGALKKAGGLEYLYQQSQENPKAFMSLVGRIVPLQADVTHQRGWLEDVVTKSYELAKSDEEDTPGTLN